MPVDAWLPIGFPISDSVKLRNAAQEGEAWQLYETEAGGCCLIARQSLAEKWLKDGLLAAEVLLKFQFMGDVYYALLTEADYNLCPLAACAAPASQEDVLAFAEALRQTREIIAEFPLGNSIYAEQYSRLLPLYTESANMDIADEIILGRYLTGGVSVSIWDKKRLYSLTRLLNADMLNICFEILAWDKSESGKSLPDKKQEAFTLPGREGLQNFFREHIIDIIENKERYRALGIGFPAPVILYGPPGCGKTFAVEKLAEYLQWPVFRIESDSIASPYIHETAKKVAETFKEALNKVPSIIIIDEMEAFLSDRQRNAGSGQHFIEEMSEFLRCIPEAIKNDVLIIGMTNHLEMIDPAIRRKERFDHIVKVDMAAEGDILALLSQSAYKLPKDESVNMAVIAQRLQGRPLSDVSFVLREAARLAGKAGQTKISQENLLQAVTLL